MLLCAKCASGIKGNKVWSAWGNNTFSISIIVPCAGSWEYLEASLVAITHLVERPDEVIVVVDGPDRRLADIAARYATRVLVNNVRLGPASARNRGAAVAQGDVLLFVDSDVILQRDVTCTIKRSFSEDVTLQAVFGSYDATPSDPGFVSQFRNLLHHYVHQVSCPDATTFWSGCGAIRRTCFEQVGGFPEQMWGVEDIALGYRLAQQGARIKLDRQLVVTHQKRWTLASMVRTDIVHRAWPWAVLILSSPRSTRFDLNLSVPLAASTAIACVVTFGILPLYFAEVVSGWTVVGASAGWLALMHGVIRFFEEKRGTQFALFAVPTLWLHHLCSGVGVVMAIGSHVGKQWFRRC